MPRIKIYQTILISIILGLLSAFVTHSFVQSKKGEIYQSKCVGTCPHVLPKPSDINVRGWPLISGKDSTEERKFYRQYSDDTQSGFYLLPFIANVILFAMSYFVLMSMVNIYAHSRH